MLLTPSALISIGWSELPGLGRIAGSDSFVVWGSDLLVVWWSYSLLIWGSHSPRWCR